MNSLTKWHNPDNFLKLFDRRNPFLDKFFEPFDNFLEIHKTAKTNFVALGDEKYRVEVALPGYEKDDIKVEFENNIVYISASSKKETSTNEDKYPKFYQKEVYTNEQRLQFPLPEGSAMGNVVFKNGLLQIDYEYKAPQSDKRKSVEIKTN